MKNKLIITFTNNGGLSFVTMVLTAYSLLDSDISKWVTIPMIILIGLFIVDVDTILTESQNENR